MPAGDTLAAWHPDGRHLAVGTENQRSKSTTRSPPPRGPLLYRRPTGGTVPTFNHAGDLLVSNDWAGIRRLWDPASGTELFHVAAKTGIFPHQSGRPQGRGQHRGPGRQTLRIAIGAEHTFAAARRRTAKQTNTATDGAKSQRTNPGHRFLGRRVASRFTSGFELAVIPDREPMQIQFDDSELCSLSVRTGFTAGQCSRSPRGAWYT